MKLLGQLLAAACLILATGATKVPLHSQSEAYGYRPGTYIDTEAIHRSSQLFNKTVSCEWTAVTEEVMHAEHSLGFTAGPLTREVGLRVFATRVYNDETKLKADVLIQYIDKRECLRYGVGYYPDCLPTTLEPVLVTPCTELPSMQLCKGMDMALQFEDYRPILEIEAMTPHPDFEFSRRLSIQGATVIARNMHRVTMQVTGHHVFLRSPVSSQVRFVHPTELCRHGTIEAAVIVPLLVDNTETFSSVFRTEARTIDIDPDVVEMNNLLF